MLQISICSPALLGHYYLRSSVEWLLPVSHAGRVRRKVWTPPGEVSVTRERRRTCHTRRRGTTPCQEYASAGTSPRVVFQGTAWRPTGKGACAHHGGAAKYGLTLPHCRRVAVGEKPMAARTTGRGSGRGWGTRGGGGPWRGSRPSGGGSRMTQRTPPPSGKRARGPARAACRGSAQRRRRCGPDRGHGNCWGRQGRRGRIRAGDSYWP